jgi:hypothetical protein
MDLLAPNVQAAGPVKELQHGQPHRWQIEGCVQHGALVRGRSEEWHGLLQAPEPVCAEMQFTYGAARMTLVWPTAQICASPTPGWRCGTVLTWS